MKRRAIHNQYFFNFAIPITVVDEALTHFAKQATAIKKLFDRYLNELELAPAMA